MLERDEKMLNLSRLTTPDALSMEDDDAYFGAENEENKDHAKENEKKTKKKYS